MQELLDAGTATQVEEVLDATGIRLVRSGLDPRQIRGFWNKLRDDLDPDALKEQSILGRNWSVRYAQVLIQARANK